MNVGGAVSVDFSDGSRWVMPEGWASAQSQRFGYMPNSEFCQQVREYTESHWVARTEPVPGGEYRWSREYPTMAELCVRVVCWMLGNDLEHRVRGCDTCRMNTGEDSCRVR